MVVPLGPVFEGRGSDGVVFLPWFVAAECSAVLRGGCDGSVTVENRVGHAGRHGPCPIARVVRWACDLSGASLFSISNAVQQQKSRSCGTSTRIPKPVGTRYVSSLQGGTTSTSGGLPLLRRATPNVRNGDCRGNPVRRLLLIYPHDENRRRPSRPDAGSHFLDKHLWSLKRKRGGNRSSRQHPSRPARFRLGRSEGELTVE